MTTGMGKHWIKGIADAVGTLETEATICCTETGATFPARIDLGAESLLCSMTHPAGLVCPHCHRRVELFIVAVTPRQPEPEPAESPEVRDADMLETSEALDYAGGGQ